MGAIAYSQILHYLVSSDKRYPQSIYDIPMERRGDAKSNFRRLVKPHTVDNGVIKHKGKEVLLQSRVEDMLKAYHDNKYILKWLLLQVAPEGVLT